MNGVFSNSTDGRTSSAGKSPKVVSSGSAFPAGTPLGNSSYLLTSYEFSDTQNDVYTLNSQPSAMVF